MPRSRFKVILSAHLESELRLRSSAVCSLLTCSKGGNRRVKVISGITQAAIIRNSVSLIISGDQAMPMTYRAYDLPLNLGYYTKVFPRLR